jgi:5'-nucleotidase
MPFILLTNDDGIDALGLPSFAAALGEIGDVEVVVPDRERSWVAKAITRFESVTVERVEVAGIEMHTTTGYPADCVQLGVHTLFDRRPDIVVSGINVGYNHGTAFLQSSGTVGAALEGYIAEVPSVAFSMGGSSDDWNAWKQWADSKASLPNWIRLAELAASMVDQMLTAGLSGVVNVGLPDSADRTTERRLTTVAKIGYDRLFQKTDSNTYSHFFGDLIDSGTDMAGTDLEAAAQDLIAITPISGVGFAEAHRKLAEAFLLKTED